MGPFQISMQSAKLRAFRSSERSIAAQSSRLLDLTGRRESFGGVCEGEEVQSQESARWMISSLSSRVRSFRAWVEEGETTSGAYDVSKDEGPGMPAMVDRRR